MGRPKGSKNKHKKTIEERFWPKVDKKTDDECWEWKAFVHPAGYGVFPVNSQPEFAHRISWIIHFGEIPKGLYVLHKCDNRKCVNPYHLFLGTYKDNAIDRDNKSRGKVPDNRGQNHGMSKLTNDDVILMRKLYAEGNHTYLGLSKMFGVTEGTIREIIKRRKWSWLK